MSMFKLKAKMSYVVICLLVSALLQGCGSLSQSNPDTMDPSSTHDTSHESHDVDAAQLSIQELIYTDIFYDEADNNLELLQVSIRVPQFVSDKTYASLDLVNAHFKRLFEAKKKQAYEEKLLYAKETYEDSKRDSMDFQANRFDFKSSVVYQKNNLVSVYHHEMEMYSGSAHPNDMYSGDNFDVRTGKRLELTNILKGTSDELDEKIKQLILAEIKKSEGTPDSIYYLEFEKNVKENFDRKNFILGLQSIQFFFNPYELSSRAAGVPMFELPYSNKEWFIAEIEVAKPSPISAEIFYKAEQLLNQNTEVMFKLYELSMLPLDIPQKGPGKQTIFPVANDRFLSYEEFELFIRSTYSKAYAEKLLTNGKYINKNNQLYGDMSKDGSRGYYVDHRQYCLQIADVTEDRAKLTIFTTENAPNESGTNVSVDITITGNMVKEEGNWLLEEMVMK